MLSVSLPHSIRISLPRSLERLMVCVNLRISLPQSNFSISPHHSLEGLMVCVNCSISLPQFMFSISLPYSINIALPHFMF